MTITVTSLGTASDTNSRSDYTIPLSVTPDANSLVLVGLLAEDAVGTVVPPSSVSGAGMVFTNLLSDFSFGPFTAGLQVQDMSIWRGMAASPSGSMITAHFPGSMTGFVAIALQVSGVSTSGTSGANATNSSATTAANGVGSLMVVAGGSAASTANAWLSFHGMTTSSTATSDGNWTDITTVGVLTPSGAISSAWTTLSTGTRVTWKSGSNTDRGGIILELVADNPAVSTSAGGIGRPYRIPEVPWGIKDPKVHEWMVQVARQLNSEAFISKFSGTDPNTSGITGIPGNLVVNVGSASSNTRMWQMAGSVASIATNTWHPFRMA